MLRAELVEPGDAERCAWCSLPSTVALIDDRLLPSLFLCDSHVRELRGVAGEAILLRLAS